MGKPTDDVVAAIKEAVDIVSLIGEYIRVEAFGSKYRALCPFHDDKKPSLQIDPQYQNYRCWACGAKGDVFTFVQQFESLSFGEAKERLAARAGIKLTADGSGPSDSKGSLYRVLDWAQKEFQKSLFDGRTGLEARQYLAERKLSEETARRHGIGFAPMEYEWLRNRALQAGFDDQTLLRAGLVKMGQKATPYDTFRGRLIVPIREATGRVIAFGGRSIPALDDGRGPKYLNSPGTDVYNKSRVLFGLEVAAESLRRDRSGGGSTGRPYLVVMEGYFDCLMAYQAGLNQCVATCGTALTPDHVKRLKGYVDRVVLMYDGDAAGQKAAKDSVELFFESEVDLRLCLLPDGLDPCDFIVERGSTALEELIANSPDAVDFAIERARELYSASGVAGRSRALDEVLASWSALPEVSRSEQQSRVDLAFNRLAEVFRMEEKSIRDRWRQLRESRSSDRERTRIDEPEEVGRARPFPPREKQIAELLVAMPSRARGLSDRVDAESITDPRLRVIVEACYRLQGELGDGATTDALRERLDDPRLDALVLELLESSPTGEAYDRGFQDVCRKLDEERQREEVVSLARLSPTASEDDHLAMLRELRKRNAL